MKLELLYRCAANYKTFIEVEVTQDQIDSNEIKIGSEIEMGELGTPAQDEFFESDQHPYKYDPEYDHNIFEVVGMEC